MLSILINEELELKSNVLIAKMKKKNAKAPGYIADSGLFEI